MFQPAKKQKLSDVVISQIMETISCGIYKKGDLLPSEKELINIYRVSRITMREALKKLADNGVILTKHGKGSFVAVDSDDPRLECAWGGTLDEIKEIYHYSLEIRLMLEPVIAAKAAAMRPDEEKLAPLALACEQSAGETSVEIFAYTRAEQFHLEMVQLLQNPVLTDWLRQLQAMENTTGRLKLPKFENQAQFMERNALMHNRILDAIRRGDGEDAFLYTKKHLQELSEQFDAYFSGLC